MAKFIKLKEVGRGSSLLINIEHIVNVQETYQGTTIVTTTHGIFNVQENVNAIQKVADEITQ